MIKKIKVPILFLAIAGLVVGTLFNHNVEATVPGVNTLVSVNNTGDGQGGNNSSSLDSGRNNQVISANGKYVAFTSSASNLVSGDTNGKPDVFVRDLVNNTTNRVSMSSSGVQADGGISWSSGDKLAISSTGRYVAFPSIATNLIDGQTITTPQIYIRDTIANTTKVVSQTNSGVLANKAGGADVNGVSDDGRFVVWVANLNTSLVSTETNTVSYYVYLTDLRDQTTTVLNHTTPSTDQYFVVGATMSCDGSLVAFSTKLQLDSSDTNANYDIYMADMRHGTEVTRVPLGAGSYTRPSFSCNGEYLVTNSGYYLHDRITGSTTVAATSTSGVVANNSTYGGSVDDRGDVVFSSNATNLRDGYTMNAMKSQLFLKHKDTGETELLSRAAGFGAWSPSNSYISSVSLSADGKTAAYGVLEANSSNLVSSDTNGYGDVFASSTGL